MGAQRTASSRFRWTLPRFRFDQPLLVSYLRRRGAAVMGAFAPFRLEPTGFRPGYVTVQAAERNEIV